MAIISYHNSLNPNADPFVYPTPPLPPANTDEEYLNHSIIPVTMPIFNLSHLHQWKPLSVAIQPQPQPQQLPVVGWPPVHGYVYYIEPGSRWQYRYEVDPQVAQPWWPLFPPEISHVGNGENEINIVGNNFRSTIAKMGRLRRTSPGKWVAVQAQPRGRRISDDDAIPVPPIAGEVMALGVTTVMIRNIPNQFRRVDLLAILDKHCKTENRNCDQNLRSSDNCKSEYDFLYLPMDYRRFWFERKISNLGYAFVNFTTATAASKFCKVYHGLQWKVAVNKKVCQVNCAKIQGIKAVRENFMNKVFWCHTDQYLPVMLEPPSDGSCVYKAISIGIRKPRVPPNYIKKCR